MPSTQIAKHYQWVGALVFFSSLFAHGQEPPPELPLADLIEQSEPGCVRIDVVFQDGSRGIGSGFVADAERKWIVTNYHVVADSKSATVRFPDGKSAEVEGWRAHYTERDLALLQIKTDTKLKALPIATALPRKGESTVAIGTPEGLAFTATQGIISAIRDGKELNSFLPPMDPENLDSAKFQLVGKWLQTSTPISPGSSGGPLLNMRGEVVGVNSGSLASGQNINFAVSCVEIQKLVDVGKRIRLRQLSQLTPSARTRLGSPGEASSSTSETIVVKLPAKRRFRHNFKIEQEQDEFDKVTILRTAWIPVDHNNRELTSLGVRISIAFDEENVMPLAIWEVGVTAQRFQFDNIDASRFQVLGGENSYELVSGPPDRKVQAGGTSEIFKGLMGLDAFIKVVLSDKVKARLGPTEMEFNSRHVECLRDLAHRIPEGDFFEGRLKIERLKPEEDPSTRRRQ